MTRVRRLLGRSLLPVSLTLVLAVTALGAAGCDTYHYYDVDLQFGSSWPGGINSAGAAQLIRVEISGADSHRFDLNVASNTKFPDLGTFEFATFADSGTLTFTADAYNGLSETPNCLFGVGTLSVPATSQITTQPTMPLVVEMMGTGCPNNP